MMILSIALLGGLVLVGLLLFLLWFFRPSYQHLLHEKLAPISRSEALEGVGQDITLLPLISNRRVSFATLAANGWGPVLEIVRVAIGIIPVCDHYIAIWPPAFRIYNYMVPNFFNIPVHTLGLGMTKEASLAMYVSSRVAECPYCSAHTCSFALRRGASAETVAKALLLLRPDAGSSNGSQGDLDNLDETDLAVIGMARGLARNNLRDDERKRFHKVFSDPSKAEWVACGAIGMGLLNKYMDALGIPLETVTYGETVDIIKPSGFKLGKAGQEINETKQTQQQQLFRPPPSADGLFTKIEHLRYVAGAIGLEMSLTRGVPSQWPMAGEYLHRLCGCRFPVLGRIINNRTRFALTAILRDTFNAQDSTTGLAIKPVMGIIFARIVKCEPLEVYMRNMVDNNHHRHDGDDCNNIFGTTTQADLDRAIIIAEDSDSANEAEIDVDTPPLLQLAKAISYSPARVTVALQNTLVKADVSAEQIVETVSWIAVLQLLQRLLAYYPPSTE